jgi:hypothetical protein
VKNNILLWKQKQKEKSSTFDLCNVYFTFVLYSAMGPIHQRKGRHFFTPFANQLKAIFTKLGLFIEYIIKRAKRERR